MGASSSVIRACGVQMWQGKETGPRRAKAEEVPHATNALVLELLENANPLGSQAHPVASG